MTAATVGDRDLTRRILRLSVAAFASGASARLCDPLLPQLAEGFAVSTGEAAHVVSAFALAYGCLQIFYGPLGDRYGKYRIVTFAALLSLLGVLGCALAADFHWLVAFRFLTGTTVAAMIPLSMAWIADKVPYEHRQHMLAYYLSGQILGVIGGQMIGGILADLTGWRGAFWGQFAIFVLAAGLLLRELRASPDIDAREQHDQAAGGFTARLLEIFRTPWSRLILSCVALEGALLFGSLAFIPTYLHQRFDISLALAGSVVGMFGIGGLTYAAFAKHLVKRLGEARLAATGGAALGLAFLLLMAAQHWLWVLPAGWAMGLGFYMLHNTLQINATQMAPHARGTAVTLFASCFFLGQSQGTVFAALVVDHAHIYAVFGSAALLLPLLGLFLARRLQRRQTGG